MADSAVQSPGTDRRDADEQLIASLYRSAPTVAPERFRAWALDQLKTRLPFDHAVWGGGTGADEQWRFQTVTCYKLPAQFPDLLVQTRPINPLALPLLKNLNTPVRMQDVCADDVFYKSEIYRQVFKPQDIARIMTLVALNPSSGIYHMLALYRRDRAQPFTDAEKIRHHRFAHHLFQARSHAYFTHLWLKREHGPVDGALAVVDRRGHFHEAQPGFLQLLEEQYGQVLEGRLPFEPPAPGLSKRIGNLTLHCAALGDLLRLHLWPTGPLDRLTPRERSVVTLISQGLSFKLAGEHLKLAPSTVANHLYRIYRKLGLSSRDQLSQLVSPSPPRKSP